MERLSKVLAGAGVASRRGAEELISQGLVKVNGRVVREQGVKVDPERDHIKVRGRSIGKPQPKMVIALNKPPGYVTSSDDPEGRSTVYDLLQRMQVRVFPIGRLDWDAEGLLLFTNDGDLAQKLMHPKYKVEKGYVVKVKGRVSPEAMKALAQGVDLEDGRTAPAKTDLLRRLERNTWLRLTITEGRYHQVKRMCEAVGHPVVKLLREQFGPIRLSDLKSGAWRALEPDEVKRLKQSAAKSAKSKASKRRATSRK